MFRQTDWTSPKGVLLVSLVGLALRLPNAFAGIGFDGDSGLYLRNALLSKMQGVYIPSRGPGYFIPDLIGQTLAGYGPVPLCLLNSFLFVLSIPVFAAILRSLNVAHRNWILWAYTLCPVSWVATSDVMVEYSLSLSGILLGWLCTLRGNFWAAGLALGAGAAMRPSQGVFILVIFIVYWMLRWGLGRGVSAGVLSLVALTMLWILPVGVLAGWHIVVSYLPYEFPWLQGLMRAAGRVLSAFGFLGSAAIAAGVVLSFQSLLRQYRYVDPAWLSFAAFLILFALFLRHPFKMNYLFLIIPFALHALSVHSHKLLVSATCLLLTLHSFVGFPSVGLISTRYDFRWIGWGTGMRDWMERREVAKQIDQLIDRISPGAVLAVQDPMIRKLEYEALRGARPGFSFTGKVVIDSASQRVFAHAATPEEVIKIARNFRREKMYITSGAHFVLKRDFGYDASSDGFIILRVDNVGL
ncbi:MAG: hypothetical protein NZ874_07210 [Fimbriimonadales bacterium]|nr:hypothetical protein [Fimbriimonadales bacterium]